MNDTFRVTSLGDVDIRSWTGHGVAKVDNEAVNNNAFVSPSSIPSNDEDDESCMNEEGGV